MKLLLLLLLLAGCTAAPTAKLAQAVTNGADDSGDPAVVALVDESGRVGCSGSLIAPHTVLTAAHCFIEPVTVHVIFGSSSAGSEVADVVDVHLPPGFDPANFDQDVALLTLRQGATVSPLPISTRAIDDSLIGQDFSTVGFGVSAPDAGDAGQKRIGTAKVTAVSARDFTSAPAPAQPCSGDSGGPALFSDGTIGGVTSHGDTACSDHAVFARLDVVMSSFIQPYLAATAVGSARLGDRCYYDEQCATQSCLPASDEPKLSFCSQACTADKDCGAKMKCSQSMCQWKPPSPGAFGSSCTQASDCASATCVEGICTTRCVAVGDQCPSGATCVNTSGIDFYCLLPRKTTGCSYFPTGAWQGWWLLLILFFVRRRNADC